MLSLVGEFQNSIESRVASVHNDHAVMAFRHHEQWWQVGDLPDLRLDWHLSTLFMVVMQWKHWTTINSSGRYHSDTDLEAPQLRPEWHLSTLFMVVMQRKHWVTRNSGSCVTLTLTGQLPNWHQSSKHPLRNQGHTAAFVENIHRNMSQIKLNQSF